MKNLFSSPAPASALRHPEPSLLPELSTALLAARYRAARVGGDFFDFIQVNGSKLLFVLLDIAGKRDTALHVAAAVQQFFRDRGKELFSHSDVEDSQAVTTLLLEMNRVLISAAKGVRCAPAFLGCYDQAIHTLSYINAGHIPGLMKDSAGTLMLEANGLPLGLFTHSTHDAQFCAFEPGAVLLLVSKGLVETRGASEEFGIERVRDHLRSAAPGSADDLCASLLQAVEAHQRKPSRFGPLLKIPGFGEDGANDITTLALMRKTAIKHAVAS